MQGEDTKLRGLSARERLVADSVMAMERATINAVEVAELLDVSPEKGGQILRRMAQKGWLTRVQRGLYAPVALGTPQGAAIEDAWRVAAVLYTPGYLAGWTAAEHWGLTEQIFNRICVVTTVAQRTREQHHGGIDFFVATTGEDRLFGLKKIWRGSSQVSVCDPSRLIIDILCSPELGAGPRHTTDIVRNYWNSPHAAPTLLLDYAERFGVGAIFKRLGFIAEQLGKVEPEWIERCKKGMSAGVSRMDPSGPDHGRIVSRWRLRINLPMELE